MTLNCRIPNPPTMAPAALLPSSGFALASSTPSSIGINRICCSPVNLAKVEDTLLKSLSLVRKSPVLRLEASRDSLSPTQELTMNKKESVEETDSGTDLFDGIKERFLTFKKLKYMKNNNRYQSLAKAQAPKFMVIACADSRVCPSSILGFEPGDAFMVRNIANLVPPFENGPSEVNAGLEFAVNTLEVENIFVIGHSCCGGIRALMSMEDEVNSSSFIRNWVVVAKNAKISTKDAVADLNFDQQCRHCEKESINRSLVNLLSYPWIEERVRKGVLSIHGGYYDFINCTFEKWTLDFKGSNEGKEGNKFAIKDRAFWS